MIRSLLASAPRVTITSISSASVGTSARSSNLAAIHARTAAGFNYPITTPRPFSGAVSTDTDEKKSSNTNKDDPSTPPLYQRKTKSEREKMLESLPVTYADISRANVAIRNGVKRTSCIKSYFLSELLGANIFLKTEFQQFTGSFKERGARNAILTLLRELGEEKLRETGVIAASAGNHALALAYHGKDLGVPVTVVMPTVAPLAKVDKCRVSPHYLLALCICEINIIHISSAIINIEIRCQNYNRRSPHWRGKRIRGKSHSIARLAICQWVR